MNGSFVQFSRTRKERKDNGDSRLSIEERYRGREQYVGKTSESAIRLVDEGFLLPVDVAQVIRVAGEHWDALINN